MKKYYVYSVEETKPFLLNIYHHHMELSYIIKIWT